MKGLMLAVLLAATTLGIAGAIGSGGGRRSEPRWEYRSLALTRDAMEDEMEDVNALGAEGWELVGQVQHQVRCHLLFKRRRP